MDAKTWQQYHMFQQPKKYYQLITFFEADGNSIEQITKSIHRPKLFFSPKDLENLKNITKNYHELPQNQNTPGKFWKKWGFSIQFNITKRMKKSLEKYSINKLKKRRSQLILAKQRYEDKREMTVHRLMNPGFAFSNRRQLFEIDDKLKRAKLEIEKIDEVLVKKTKKGEFF